MITNVQTKIIELSSPVNDDKTKTLYEQIELREPLLMQVEQFFAVSAKESGLAGMRTLIALTGNISEQVVKNMAYTDFKKCQEYLLGFLNGTPSESGVS
ncbi:phage tail assembly protein [Pectobacterium versatile]|uniref:phage tail assembly protein n=1 Tax=Pectobacterium versatile TaxID=2488639 RepID=UPI003017CE26